MHRYLQAARDPLLWKLDDLSECDVRRPLTPTGTTLLGLVKHLAGVERWYFGDAFGRDVGQADVVRSSSPAPRGCSPTTPACGRVTGAWWADNRDHVERVAHEAGQRERAGERGRSGAARPD